MITTHCLDDPYILTLLCLFCLAFFAMGFGYGYLHRLEQERLESKNGKRVL